MLLNPFTLHTPTTISELTGLCRTLDRYKLKAGGTFIINNLKLLKRKGNKTPSDVISLRHIEALRGVTQDADNVSIGAMTTIKDLQQSAVLTGNLEFLKRLCQDISTTPIRHVATVGGNLACRYTWTELPAVMIGLDAVLHFITKEDKEYTLKAELFFQQQAKAEGILIKIVFPKMPNARYAYQRVKKSPYVDIPLLSLLIRLNVDPKGGAEARVAVNTGEVFAQRDQTLEAFLNQTPLTADVPAQALAHLDEALYDARSTDYKQHMFRVSIQKALEDLI